MKTTSFNTSIFPAIRKLLSVAISFPCPACREMPPDKKTEGLCVDCHRKIPFLYPPYCPGCGGENDGIFALCPKCLKEEKRPWSRAISIMKMEGFGRELLHRYKYKNDVAMARPFGEIAASFVRNSDMGADLIVPVPLHWTREFLRGYNQSYLFATILSEFSRIPLKKILKRRKMTPKQTNLDRERRKLNLKNAFSFSSIDGEICRNRTILLVDDVITTGSTLSAASSVLLDSGAKEVNILTLARG